MGKNKKAFLATIVFIALLVFGCGAITQFQDENTSSSPAAQVATRTPIPGWQKFEDKDIQIWLPETYVGGNLGEDLEVVVSNLRRLGPEFEQAAALIEQNPDLFVLWATDSNVGPSGFLTNIYITTEKVLSSVTLDTYIDVATQQYPPQFQVVAREKVNAGPYEAGKMVLEFEINGMSGKQLSYIVNDGSTFWVITYSTGLSEYEDRLPEIEQIINSFQIAAN